MAPEHVPSCFSWSEIFLRKLDASNLLSHTIFAMPFVKWSIEKTMCLLKVRLLLYGYESRANCTENIKYCYHFVMEGFIRSISFNLVVHNNKLHSSFIEYPYFRASSYGNRIMRINGMPGRIDLLIGYARLKCAWLTLCVCVEFWRVSFEGLIR